MEYVYTLMYINEIEHLRFLLPAQNSLVVYRTELLVGIPTILTSCLVFLDEALISPCFQLPNALLFLSFVPLLVWSIVSTATIIVSPPNRPYRFTWPKRFSIK